MSFGSGGLLARFLLLDYSNCYLLRLSPGPLRIWYGLSDHYGPGIGPGGLAQYCSPSDRTIDVSVIDSDGELTDKVNGGTPILPGHHGVCSLELQLFVLGNHTTLHCTGNQILERFAHTLEFTAQKSVAT